MDGRDSAGATRGSFRGADIAPVSFDTTRAPTGSDTPRIPDYLQKTYHWAYLNPRNVKLLDREWIVRTILWQQHRRLAQAAMTEIEAGQHILQPACVYGNFSALLAEHIGPEGKLEVFDVAEIQVQNCHRKLLGFKNAVVRHQDILYLRDETFDAVCCYFLMHELPNDYKHGVTRVLLNSVRPGGKVVFVDYHRPHWAHPLKIITSLVFDTLEPFAKELWNKEIAAFSGYDSRFSWRKETYFGGLFQKVVAIRKE